MIVLQEQETQVLSAMERQDDGALQAGVRELVKAGYSSAAVEALLQQGMGRVQDLFEKGEYFLADLIVSGLMFRTALGQLLPQRSTAPQEKRGRVLIGVVAGDIHDIGKDIVAQVLRTEQFDILDLGVDVPAADFVRAAAEYAPDVIALSGVMGSSSLEMQKVIRALADAGITPFTPVIVGGSCVSELVMDQIGADEYARGPLDTVLFCKSVMERKLGHA